MSFKQKWKEEKKKNAYIYFFYILNNPHNLKTKKYPINVLLMVTVILTHQWTYIYTNIDKLDFWIKYIVYKPVLRNEEFKIFAAGVLWKIRLNYKEWVFFSPPP